MMDYLKCSVHYFNDFSIPQILEKQLDRLDLDTICAYELYQMKKGFCNDNVLDLS
jgi:hypothetical protein